MENQAIIEKIRKIQALADNAGTEAEAATAAGMVAELCRKHNLEIGVARLAAEETTATEASHEHDTSRYQHHWSYLSKACAEMFGVGVYRNNTAKITKQGCMVISRERQIAIVFYGLKASVESAKITYNYLIASVESMLEGWARRGDYGGREAFRSFRMGCSKRIYEAAQALKSAKQQIEGVEIAALVRLENQLVTKHAATMKLRSGARTSASVDRDAFSAGYAAGARVNLHGANSRMLN